MTNGNMFFMGRLATGVSTARARSILDALAARYDEERPDSRSKPSIGAGRGAIVRQLLVESAVLATLGGTAGLILGVAASRALVGVDLPLPGPVNLEVGLSGRVLLFAGAASLIAALVFGLTPALEATHAPVASTLRDESGSAGGRKKGRIRGILVAAQMTLSTVLIFGSGLFMRSLQEATSLDVGFDTGPAAVVTVDAWASEMTDEEQLLFARELDRSAAALPGVRRHGVSGRLPLALGTTGTSFDIPGVDPPPNQDRHILE